MPRRCSRAYKIREPSSVGVLFEELGALYTAFSSGQSSPLPPLPIQYADFAHWQRQWLRGAVLDQQLAYWQQQLAGPLPVLTLPTDHPRPAAQTFRGASLEFALSRSLSDALAALSRHEHCTLFMTLLAAFQALLHRYSGQDDILVGSPIANRTRPETEREKRRRSAGRFPVQTPSANEGPGGSGEVDGNMHEGGQERGTVPDVPSVIDF